MFKSIHQINKITSFNNNLRLNHKRNMNTENKFTISLNLPKIPYLNRFEPNENEKHIIDAIDGKYNGDIKNIDTENINYKKIMMLKTFGKFKKLLMIPVGTGITLSLLNQDCMTEMTTFAFGSVCFISLLPFYMRYKNLVYSSDFTRRDSDIVSSQTHVLNSLIYHYPSIVEQKLNKEYFYPTVSQDKYMVIEQKSDKIKSEILGLFMELHMNRIDINKKGLANYNYLKNYFENNKVSKEEFENFIKNFRLKSSQIDYKQEFRNLVC